MKHSDNIGDTMLMPAPKSRFNEGANYWLRPKHETPSGAPAVGKSPVFADIVNSAGRLQSEEQNTRDYAIDHGIDEQALERYVSGACSLYEQETIQSLLTRCKWTRSYVVNKIKSRRRSS